MHQTGHTSLTSDTTTIYMLNGLQEGHGHYAYSQQHYGKRLEPTTHPFFRDYPGQPVPER